MRQGFAASTPQSAAQILDRFLNILPTVRIREGHRVKVYLSGDRELYKKRNQIERLFRRLKGFRRIFSRFEKLDVVFLAFIYFAFIIEALR